MSTQLKSQQSSLSTQFGQEVRCDDLRNKTLSYSYWLHQFHVFIIQYILSTLLCSSSTFLTQIEERLYYISLLLVEHRDMYHLQVLIWVGRQVGRLIQHYPGKVSWKMFVGPTEEAILVLTSRMSVHLISIDTLKGFSQNIRNVVFDFICMILKQMQQKPFPHLVTILHEEYKYMIVTSKFSL